MRPGRSVSRWEGSRMITVCDANSLMTYCKDGVTCVCVSVCVRVCVRVCVSSLVQASVTSGERK